MIRKGRECPTPQGKPLRLTFPLRDGVVTLRQYAIEDAPAAFALIDRNRTHLSRFAEETAKKYPTLESFEASIITPNNPLRIRMGIWNQLGVIVGSINLTPKTPRSYSAEIGYYLGFEFQHQGYMTRSVSTLTDFAFDWLGYSKLYAKVSKENVMSAKVLLRAGYMESGEREGKVIYSKKPIDAMDINKG